MFSSVLRTAKTLGRLALEVLRRKPRYSGALAPRLRRLELRLMARALGVAAHDAGICLSYLFFDQEFIRACIERISALHAALYHIRLIEKDTAVRILSAGPGTRCSVGGSAVLAITRGAAEPKDEPVLDC